MIMPPDLQRRIVAARRAGDLHSPTLDQLVVADLMVDRAFRTPPAPHAQRLP
jgi:DNA-binding transcriptional MocR family regulator